MFSAKNALLQRDAVSKEAYEQVKTELATLNADIENIKASIDMTELRAPFDGIIGLRQVSVGAYASPTTVVAKLTKVSPLKVEFAVPERYARENKKKGMESGLQSRRTAQRLSCTSICHRIQSGYGNSLTEHSRHLPNRTESYCRGAMLIFS